MIDGQILTFIATITLLTIAPGADTVMVTRNSLRGGFRDGFVTCIGICIGLFVHALVSAGGVSLILLGSANLFQAVKFAGAAYLVWLGVQSLYSAMKGGSGMLAPDARAGRLSVRRSLQEGLLSNILNPKIVVFYMAFLPQFMDPAGNLFVQGLVLAAIHFAITMVWQSGVAAMVHKARAFLTAPRVARWFDGVIGTMLMAFGLRLALED